MGKYSYIVSKAELMDGSFPLLKSSNSPLVVILRHNEMKGQNEDIPKPSIFKNEIRKERSILGYPTSFVKGNCLDLELYICDDLTAGKDENRLECWHLLKGWPWLITRIYVACLCQPVNLTSKHKVENRIWNIWSHSHQQRIQANVVETTWVSHDSDSDLENIYGYINETVTRLASKRWCFLMQKLTSLASLKAQVAITMAAQGPFPDTAKVGHATMRVS